MIEGPKIPNNLNDHLAEGVKPIIACVGEYSDFKKLKSEYPGHIQQLNNKFGLGDAKNIDWENGTYGAPYQAEAGEEGSLGRPNAYLISPIDGANKLSRKFVACTGIVVSGIDKETGKNISFVTHQSPPISSSFDFLTDLRMRLMEMKKRCKAGTIDAVFVGGRSSGKSGVPEKEQYENITNTLSAEVQEILGFRPIIINGAKKDLVFDDIYYDNENRRLYFVRGQLDSKVGNFIADDVEKEGKVKQHETRLARLKRLIGSLY